MKTLIQTCIITGMIALFFSCGGSKKAEDASSMKSDSVRITDSLAYVSAKEADSMARADSVAKPASPVPKKDTSKGHPRLKALKMNAEIDNPKYHVIDIVYGTNRKWESITKRPFYGTQVSQGYRIGTLSVSIPFTHNLGEIERQGRISRFFRGEKRDEFMSIFDLDTIQKNAVSKLQTMLSASTERDAFIYVHGFANSFEDAALRTAQLKFDLNFQGAALMFSWPSEGSKTIEGYENDGNHVLTATDHFESFIKKVISTGQPKKIHIIAHSMGNRLLSNVVKLLASQHQGVMFNEIILAAPDVDAQVFRNDIAPKISKLSKRVTLYMSDHDLALKFSQQLNKGLRAGETKSQIFSIGSLQTVDATEIQREDLFDHTYFANTRPLITDIFLILKFNLQPKDRNLDLIKHTDGEYWMFKK